MTRSSRIRVVVYNSRTAGVELHRTLVSLSCQDVGSARLEIVVPTRNLHALETRNARLLIKALDLRHFEAIDSQGLNPTEAINSAAQGATDHLALVPEGARLNPSFLSRLLDSMARTPQSAAGYCAHTAGNAEGLAYVRMRPFRSEMLVRRNPIGPAVVIKSQNWDALGGLRPGLWLAWWDFWLRMALLGGKIAHVPDLLAACPVERRLGLEEEGSAKALLVTHTPGAFEPDVVRWAMARLRGDSWAGPFEPGRIPGPRDVSAMWSGYSPVILPGSAGWQGGLRHTA